MLKLAWQGWGALRYASNAAALTMFYAEWLMSLPSPSSNVTAYAAQLFNYVSSRPAKYLYIGESLPSVFVWKFA